MLNVQYSRRQGYSPPSFPPLWGETRAKRARGSLTDNAGTVDAERTPAYGLQWAENQLRKLEVFMTRRVLALPAAIAIITAVLFLRLVASAQSATGQAAQVSSSDPKSKVAAKPWT